MCSVESDCHICLGSLVKYIFWLLSLLVAVAEEGDNGKTIQNIVKMSEGGCIISVRKISVLPASLAGSLGVCVWAESESFFLPSAGQVSSMPAKGNHWKIYMPHSTSVNDIKGMLHENQVTDINNGVC